MVMGVTSLSIVLALCCKAVLPGSMLVQSVTELLTARCLAVRRDGEATSSHESSISRASSRTFVHRSDSVGSELRSIL
jgi:hypothetical protein